MNSISFAVPVVSLSTSMASAVGCVASSCGVADALAALSASGLGTSIDTAGSTLLSCACCCDCWFSSSWSLLLAVSVLDGVSVMSWLAAASDCSWLLLAAVWSSPVPSVGSWLLAASWPPLVGLSLVLLLWGAVGLRKSCLVIQLHWLRKSGKLMIGKKPVYQIKMIHNFF